jgi:hypothetical protein
MTTETTTSTTKIAAWRPSKEKAVRAVVQDSVDISDPLTHYAKSYREVVPSILLYPWRFVVRDDREEDCIVDHWMGDQWTSNLAALCRMLKGTSREMVMVFAGTPRDRLFGAAFDNGNKDDNGVVLDNLVVLCYCPHSVVKQCLLGLSTFTLEWDVDPPSTLATRGRHEGGGAYVCVSWEIWDRVHKFMDGLMGRALTGLPPLS